MPWLWNPQESGQACRKPSVRSQMHLRVWKVITQPVSILLRLGSSDQPWSMHTYWAFLAHIILPSERKSHPERNTWCINCVQSLNLKIVWMIFILKLEAIPCALFDEQGFQQLLKLEMHASARADMPLTWILSPQPCLPCHFSWSWSHFRINSFADED